MSWTAVLKAGAKSSAKWLGKGAKATAETVGKTVLHPTETLKGAGTALKTAAVGGSLGYVGWKKITTDDSVVGIVSDALVGEKTTQKVSDTVQGAVDGMKDLKDSVSNMSESVSTTMGSVDSKMSGVSTFISEMTSGGGGEMMSGFLGNVAQGNVSGLSIAGLALSAFLLFGRFGWMGKIAGALMAMTMIGNNSKRSIPIPVSRDLAVAQAETATQPQIRMPQEEEQIHRSRR